VPLFLKGKYTVKQPVFHSDVVTGIMNSLYDPDAVGQTYEAVGPERFTMNELFRYMYEQTGRDKDEWNFHITELMLDPGAFARAYFAEKTPFGGVRTFHQTSIDLLERQSISDQSQGYPNLTDLGVKLSTVEQKMPWELACRDAFAYYVIDHPEEMKKVTPPASVNFSQERYLQATRESKGLLNILEGII